MDQETVEGEIDYDQGSTLGREHEWRLLKKTGSTTQYSGQGRAEVAEDNWG